MHNEQTKLIAKLVAYFANAVENETQDVFQGMFGETDFEYAYVAPEGVSVAVYNLQQFAFMLTVEKLDEDQLHYLEYAAEFFE